jgi:hypothetical protein
MASTGNPGDVTGDASTAVPKLFKLLKETLAGNLS